MSYIITSERIKEYVIEFINTNQLRRYDADELLQWLYRILNVGYRLHQWNYNNFAFYTLGRICYKQFRYCDVLDRANGSFIYSSTDGVSLSIAVSSNTGDFCFISFCLCGDDGCGFVCLF